MTDQPSQPDPAREQHLERATAALRDEGIRNGTAVPEHLRRATLQALWVADAAKYETYSRRKSSAMRLGTRFAAAVLVVFLGVLIVLLVRRAMDEGRARTALIRTVPPPQVATNPATTQPHERDAQLIDINPDHAVVPAAPGHATIAGRVVYGGIAPEPEQIDVAAVKECALQHPDGLFSESLVVAPSGGIANVVVSLVFAEGVIIQSPPPQAPAVLDQKGCRYIPHVLAVQVGQPIVVKNSDPFLHNVHSLSLNNPAFNFGQPSIDPGRRVNPMQAAERFRIKCDVHPWMSAYVNVFDHPYFAVTNADGAFTIPGNLPDGTYTTVAWHESLGDLQAQVQVAGGKAAPVEFRYTAPQ